MGAAEGPEKPISLFYSYSHRDEALRGELEAHLSFLRRSELIAEWHDRMIGAGDDWKGQIDRQLAAADIILLLVSADFIHSDYCWGEEMTKALARHQHGEARVIPVILRPCQWQMTPLGSLQAVPKDGKPVSEWSNHDAAFDDIAAAIYRTIADLQQQRRRAAEQAQQQAEEARKRQAAEEQQREAHPLTAYGKLKQDEALSPTVFPTRRRLDVTAYGMEALRAVEAEAARVQKRFADFAVFRDIDEPWCPEMVALPAGEFVMGSPEKERYSDEGPQHRVTIGYPFAIGRYPITVGEYRRSVEATGHSHAGDLFIWDGSKWEQDASKSWRDPGFQQTDRHPVVGVSWLDARAYVAWLERRTGKPYRLPSEAEWEYAYRAGTTTRYAVGAGAMTPEAKRWERKLGKTTEVGADPPNAWGLYDMYGNVWEWVEDVWHDSYKGAPTDGTAWIDSERETSSSSRVNRGRSRSNAPRANLSPGRDGDGPDLRIDYLGFRVARTLD